MKVFSKIFLSFWLALILSIVLTAVVHPFREAPRPGGFRESMMQLLTVHAHAILRDLEQGRTAEVSAAVHSLGQSSGIQLYLLDARGDEVTGRPVPGDVRLAMADDETDTGPGPGNNVVARQLVDEHGHHYTMVAQFTPPPHRPHSRSAFLLPQLVALFIISGIVCFLLARYLTTPIVRLRGVTQQFADGNLAARAPVGGARKDEIALLVNDFNQMAERIAQLITAQRRLISDISHELRSPLARFSIAIGVLRQKTGPEATATLDRLERETERLDHIIGQLLTLSSFESGERAVDGTEFDLADVMREVATDADYEARDRHCRVQIVAAEPCPVRGNRELLRSAIENILRNAVRYTAEGTTVEVGLRAQTVDGQQCAMLAIRDHGPGVPDKDLANIFRPFFRLADARDRQSGGVGLGLAISDRAIRLHGGSVSASNMEDGGLTVNICLPLPEARGCETERPAPAIADV